ncbi:MAG: peptidase S41, partial [Deltaproteobacteria bacterium]|nr:peptidase S41 [Deltaproteobacteria bacterium]
PKGRSIQATGIVPDIVLENVPVQEARGEPRRPALREENLPGHLGSQQEQKPKPAQPQTDDALENDAQLRRALELLRGWEVFKQMVQRKAA